MVIWLPPDFHKNGYKKSAWICSYPCARWLVFGFARVQISRFRQNRRFSSVILPLCFLTVKTAKTPIKSGFSVGASILCNPFGGEGGIRTLEPLLTVTRFPIVRARPATRLLRKCSASKILFYWRLKYNTTKKIVCQYLFKIFLKIILLINLDGFTDLCYNSNVDVLTDVLFWRFIWQL